MLSYERTSGWTLTSHALSYVARVSSRAEIDLVLEEARRRSLSVTLRGAGYSYGDVILNPDGVVIDLTHMNRILAWDPATGQMTVEPGVTFEQALQVCLRDNWVVSSVPGIRHPTLGGAVANNVHGKNAWNEGNLGDSVVAFKLLAGNGRVYQCSRTENQELFFAAIGGLGLLGIFLEIVLQCKQIPSPYLEVSKWTVPNLESMLEDFEAVRSTTDFHIGWVDCFSRGADLGRGTIHTSRFIERPSRSAKSEILGYISPYILGVFPRTWVWPMLKPFFGNTLMSAVNTVKFHTDKVSTRRSPYVQNYFEFTFLLDMIPNWRVLFTPRGYLELEPVIPFDSCARTMRKLIELTQQNGRPSHLTAIKSHRADESMLSYSVDGCSIGIDLPLNAGGKAEEAELFYRMTELVLEAGGRSYLAKDEMLTVDHFQQMFPRWREFEALKQRYDPDLLFQSAMYRRLFQAEAVKPALAV